MPKVDHNQLERISPTATLEEYSEARSKGWLHVSDRGFEVLSFEPGWEIIDHKLTDIGGGFGTVLDQVGIVDGPYRDEWNKQVVCHDRDEVRDRMRAAFARLLRAPQVARLQGTVRELINAILDDIVDPSDVDFMVEFANRLPTLLFCKLVSAPLSLEADVLRITSQINPPILNFDRAGVPASEAAYFEGLAFMREHLAVRRKDLNDDFASELIRCELDGLLKPDEVETTAMSLLMASMDNTMHQLGLTFGTLLEDRSRWLQVTEKPSLSTKAAEETFRMCPRFNAIGRHAPTDIEVADVTIPANSWMQVATRSCGRDQQKFENPDQFRLDRQPARALQFGSVQYSCLGATLARLEISESVRILAERFPNIRMLGDWRYEIGPMTSECVDLRVALV